MLITKGCVTDVVTEQVALVLDITVCEQDDVVVDVVDVDNALLEDLLDLGLGVVVLWEFFLLDFFEPEDAADVCTDELAPDLSPTVVLTAPPTDGVV